MNRAKLLVLILLNFAQAGFVFSEENPDSAFQFRRKLEGIKTGWNKIYLAGDLGGKLNINLSDFRIFNIQKNDTTEIPYLIRQRVFESESSGKLLPLNKSYERKCCSWVSFETDHGRPANRIKLNVSNSEFDKYLKLEGSEDGVSWKTILEDARVTRIRNPENPYENTVVQFPAGRYKLLRVSFDDDGSDRIYVTGAEVWYTSGREDLSEQIDFKLKEEDLKKEKVSRKTLLFNGPKRVSKIRVAPATEAQYRRNVNIYIPGRNGRWRMWHTGILFSGDTSSLSFQPVPADSLLLEIFNADNPPAAIASIKTFAEIPVVVTRLDKEGEYFMYYGSVSNVDVPQYDINWFRDRIPAALNELTAGQEEIILPAKTRPERSKTLLWITLGLCGFAILFFSIRMIRSAGTE